MSQSITVDCRQMAKICVVVDTLKIAEHSAVFVCVRQTVEEEERGI